MFNPTYPFTKDVLEATVKKGCLYFVRNTYQRAFDHFENMKAYFLITHYNDSGKANAHYNSISNDGNRFLYDWNDKDHQQKLYVAAAQPPGFKIYSTYFLPNYKDKITRSLKDKINRYMVAHTKWKPERGETINLDFYMQYGSLYTTMKYNGQEIRVKFDDIEKM